MEQTRRLQISLFLLRISVFLVMLVWTLDKFLRPDYAAAVFEHFYYISGLSSTTFRIIGAIELVIIVNFLVGFKKRFTYGAVFILHAISTVSCYRQYLAPFGDGNIMFFAAWPMLAAAFTLYLLRSSDTMWVIDKG